MIAPRRTEKKRLEMNIRRLLLLIVLEAVIIFGLAGFLVSRICTTNNMVFAMDRDLAKLQPDVKQMQNYQAKTKALAPKLDTLNDAKTDTLRWCRMLSELSRNLPNKTWLTRISTAPLQPDATDITINLNGVSANQQLVGQTMLQFHDTIFSTIDLHYTQKASLGSLTAVEFEMAAGIAIPKKDNKEVAKS
jgi:Tfp pilus assembly protein PilN